MGNEISEREQKQAEYEERIKRIKQALVLVWAHKKAISRAAFPDPDKLKLIETQEKQLQQEQADYELLLLTGTIASASTARGDRVQQLREDISEIKAKQDDPSSSSSTLRQRKKKKKSKPFELNTMPQAPSRQVKVEETLSVLEERTNLLS